MTILKSTINLRARVLLVYSFSLIRLLCNPKKLIWILQIKLKARFLPADVLPSYEHRFLFDIIDEPSAFIDIGFNKGQFSSLALIKRPKSRVLAFDPSPESSAFYAPPLLKAFPHRFTFYNLAVGDRDELIVLNRAISFDNNSLLIPTDENIRKFPRAAMSHQSETVSMTRLGSIDFRDFGNSLFLKVDVQGFEIFVLRGLGESLAKKIRWIYVELAGLSLYHGQASSLEIKSYIYSLGFSLVSDYNIHKDPSTGSVIYCDSLFERV
jgi:FkbM family methyltransferase